MIIKLIFAAACVAASGFASLMISPPESELDGARLTSIYTPLVGGVPDCVGVCTPTGTTIPDKTAVIQDATCQFLPWSVPHREETYDCVKYSCANGWYYQSDNVKTQSCTSSDLQSIQCPSGTCNQ